MMNGAELMRLAVFPRMLGFGRNPIDQVYFGTWAEAAIAIKNAFNERSIYFSIYPFQNDGGGKLVQVDKISFDLEHPQKLENPLWECRRIQALARKVGADCIGIVTRRGLHVHILINPTWMTEKEASRRVSNIQLKIVNHLKLRTVCWDSLGDIHRLLRWPGSIYQDKHGKVWPIRCIEAFSDDESPDLKRERAKSVGFRVFNHDLTRKRASFEALDSLLGGVLPACRPAQEGTRIELPGDFQDTEILPVTMVFSKPCVRYWLSTGNPPPYIRVYAVIYFKKLGKSVEEVAHWFGNLAMADYDYNLTKKYIERIYEKYNYLPGHKKLRGRGFCLHEDCPQYKPELDQVE